MSQDLNLITIKSKLVYSIDVIMLIDSPEEEGPEEVRTIVIFYDKWRMVINLAKIQVHPIWEVSEAMRDSPQIVINKLLSLTDSSNKQETHCGEVYLSFGKPRCSYKNTTSPYHHKVIKNKILFSSGVLRRNKD